jgi:hypothetical protein
MVKQPSSPQDLPDDFNRAEFDRQEFDPGSILFSTRYAAYIPSEPPAQAAGHPGFGILPTADGGHVIWALR